MVIPLLSALILGGVTGAGELTVSAAPPEIRPGGEGEITVAVTVAEGYHVNANPASFDYLIPLTISLDLPEGFEAGEIRYPAGREADFSFSEDPIGVYEGSFVVPIVIHASDLEEGEYPFTGTVRYQACDDAACYRPGEAPLEGLIRVVNPGPTVSPPPTTSPPTTSPPTTPPPTTPPPDTRPLTPSIEGEASEGPGSQRPLRSEAAEGGLLALGLIGIFILGLGLNLTPCVYPVLPVTLGFFGSQSSGSVRRAFSLALVYTVSLAAVFGLLGTAASLGGLLLGEILRSKAVAVLISVLLLVLASSPLGLWEFRLPVMGGTARRGLLGAAVMGGTVGLVAAPCIGPFVAAVALLVAERGDPVFGFLAFFVMGLGLGLPHLVLASAAGSLDSLPRPGAWMVWTKKAFGSLLLLAAVYFLIPVIGPGPAFTIMGILAVILGIYLGLIEKTATPPRFRFVRAAVLVLLVGGGALLLRPGPPPGAIEFEPFTVTAAASPGMPAFVDLRADWCLPCLEMEATTFNDTSVARAAEGFRSLRLDVTSEVPPDVSAWIEAHDILSVPTVVFLTPEGEEIEDLRVVGYIGPAAFIDRLSLAAERGR